MNKLIANEQKVSIVNDLGEVFAQIVRDVIKQERTNSMTAGPLDEADRFLNVTQAAEILCVSTDWLYDHWKQLPFAKKINQKMLRFSARGIQRYLETRRGRC